MNVLIIYNPVSGILYQHRDAVLKRILAREYPHVHTRWHYTTTHGSFEGISPNEFDRIIACGGDGTVKEVAAWIIKNTSSVPLAIIPNGTANVLAQSLGIPLSPREALRASFEAPVQSIDVGIVNNRDYFLIAAGCGFHSSVIKNTTRRLKRILGFFAYIVGLIRTFFHITPAKIFIKFDGHEQMYNAQSVFVSNFSSFFNLTLNPDSRIDDGYLNVTIYRALSFSDFLILLRRIVRGEYAPDWRFSYYKTKQIYILPFSKHISMQIDGELVTLPYLDISVVPSALRIVAKKLA